MPAFRFSVQGASLREPAWADFVRRAEDYGYDCVSMADHFDGRPGPLLALAYAAAITDRVHLGTSVLAVDFRNPALLAQEIETLDELSQGRVEPGFGVGSKRDDYDLAGIPFDSPSVRIGRLAALVPVVRASMKHGGRVLIGGGGPRILTLAAQIADVVSIVPMNPGGSTASWGQEVSSASFAAKAEFVRAAAGPRVDDIELCTRLVTATDEPLANALSPDASTDCPMVLIRPVEAMVDKLLRLREDVGLSYWTVSARFMHEFAPVVERLTGTDPLARVPRSSDDTIRPNA